MHVAAAALGTVGGARLVRARVRRGQVCGGRLPDLARPQEDFRPRRGARADVALQPRQARLFRDGFVVNLLNPKTAIFFLAFLPQFVEVGRGHVAMQVAVLGLLFTALGFVTDGC